MDSEGRVYSWGENIHGQLGLGDTQDRQSPEEIKFFEDKTLVQISLGNSYSLALDNEGIVYSWGQNTLETGATRHVGAGPYRGIFGIEDNKDKHIPTPIPYFKENNIFITQVTTGYKHSLALDKDGQVYAFGANERGQLGFGYVDSKPMNRIDVVPFLKGKKIIKVVVGSWHNLALDSEGNVYSWGRKDFGQLGLGGEKGTLGGCENDKHEPTLITFFKDNGMTIQDIASRADSSLALDSQGRLYVWGKNDEKKDEDENYAPGSLGIDGTENTLVPTLVQTLKDKKITEIYAGTYHSLAKTEEGEIYVWGQNKYGQLGLVSPQVQKTLAESQDIIRKHDISDYQESGEYKIANNVLKIFEDPHNKLIHIQGGNFSHDKIEITGETIHLSDLSLTARDVIKIRLTGKEGKISLVNCNIKTPRLVILAKDKIVTIEKSYFDIEKSFELRLSQKSKKETSVWSKLLPTYLYGPIASLNIDESTEIIIDGIPYKSFDDKSNNLHLIKVGSF